MQPYPAVTNCGNTPVVGIEAVRLPHALRTGPLTDPADTAPSSAAIERHLAEFFRIASITDVAQFCHTAAAFRVSSTARPLAVSNKLFMKLLAVSEASGLELRDVVTTLLAYAPRDLCS